MSSNSWHGNCFTYFCNSGTPGPCFYFFFLSFSHCFLLHSCTPHFTVILIYLFPFTLLWLILLFSFSLSSFLSLSVFCFFLSIIRLLRLTIECYILSLCVYCTAHWPSSTRENCSRIVSSPLFYLFQDYRNQTEGPDSLMSSSHSWESIPQSEKQNVRAFTHAEACGRRVSNRLSNFQVQMLLLQPPGSTD